MREGGRERVCMSVLNKSNFRVVDSHQDSKKDAMVQNALARTRTHLFFRTLLQNILKDLSHHYFLHPLNLYQSKFLSQT